jgi:hypothetical protein
VERAAAEILYPFELVKKAFGPREGGSESKPTEAPGRRSPPAHARPCRAG